MSVTYVCHKATEAMTPAKPKNQVHQYMFNFPTVLSNCSPNQETIPECVYPSEEMQI